MELVEALEIGQVKIEAEAEGMLASIGIEILRYVSLLYHSLFSKKRQHGKWFGKGKNC
jgi:hypothetical protein